MDDIWSTEQCISYLRSGNVSLKRIRSLLSVNGILHGSRHDTLDILLDRATTLLDDNEQLRRQLTTRFSDSHVIHQGHRDGVGNHGYDACSDNTARPPPSQIDECIDFLKSLNPSSIGRLLSTPSDPFPVTGLSREVVMLRARGLN
ncbi:hypothetical protein DL93DRAFT_225115 [Clavulina sp. PMI_390]|nr:hypothetical protein DL93DRAFT_225115 [Clavulina sp. PMI_390]